MIDIQQLNADYGITNKVKFTEGQGGLPMIEVQNEYAQATISLYAGQVLSFKPVNQTEDVMFVSKQAYYQVGKAIKGGTPICWPWFGPDPENQGRSSHGFVRNRLWQMRDVSSTIDGATKVVLGLEATAETQAIWNYDFDLAIAITVGNTLTIELITRNTGKQAFSITQALHTYFQIADLNQVEVLGLENKTYIDKVDGGKEKTQSGVITFSGECDRIYLDVPATLIIKDASLNRKIKITATNSKTAIVWNPGSIISASMADLDDQDYQHFVCVETANAADEIIEIPAASEYKLTANYAVESL
ncbi:aldose 1-epimerase [Chondrocystis sp. NIES-4102]|nr:aldose 1-epimerase [Chondrocystis sp. NIES-4102]